MALKSPRNGMEMEVRVFGGVEVDVDPATGGMWLDASELEALTDWFHDADDFEKLANRHSGALSHDSASGPCPRCETSTLGEHLMPCFDDTSVVLDICGRCKGLWIDGPELGPVRQTMMKNRGAQFTARIRVPSSRSWWLRTIYPSWLKNFVDGRRQTT